MSLRRSRKIGGGHDVHDRPSTPACQILRDWHCLQARPDRNHTLLKVFGRGAGSKRHVVLTIFVGMRRTEAVSQLSSPWYVRTLEQALRSGMAACREAGSPLQT